MPSDSQLVISTECYYSVCLHVWAWVWVCMWEEKGKMWWVGCLFLDINFSTTLHFTSCGTKKEGYVFILFHSYCKQLQLDQVTYLNSFSFNFAKVEKQDTVGGKCKNTGISSYWWCLTNSYWDVWGFTMSFCSTWQQRLPLDKYAVQDWFECYILTNSNLVVIRSFSIEKDINLASFKII